MTNGSLIKPATPVFQRLRSTPKIPTDMPEAPGSSSLDLVPRVSGLALGPLLGLAGLIVVLLIVFAGGYGYHRDELYFLAAGNHLAWGYPDQGPLTPLLAHLMNTISPGSLTVLRVPSALMSGATVLLTGMIARELGANRRAQQIAAACAAVASIVLVVGHLLSTSTFDLSAWSLLSWLVTRIIRTREQRLWLVAGVLTGVALLNKPLIACFAGALAVGLLIAGPRQVLRSRWLWAGVLIALVIWSPWLIWQGTHGWPQLKVSSAIAHGASTSSQPRWALLPFQLLLVSPVLSPVWIAGLAAFTRRPQLRTFAFFAVAWLTLEVAFLITGGKPYYLAGMFPVLLAAGAIETDTWLQHGRPRLRRGLLAAAILLSGLVSAVIALPVLPAKQAGIVVAINPDAGETIGWPQFTQIVARIDSRTDDHAVLFTSNYGEAGAIDRYGPALGLPHAYSGHNGFGDWPSPSDRPAPVIVIGLSAAALRDKFTGCHLAAQINNAADIHNQEQGADVDLCAGPRRPWSQIWNGLRHLG